MKRLISLLGYLTLFSIFSMTQAAPVYHPSGPNLVYGEMSNGRSVTSNITNPAAAATTFTPGDSDFSFGIMPSFGFGVEIGDADNIFNEIDATAARFEATISDPDAFASILDTGDASAIATEIDSVRVDTNNLLQTIEEKGYAKGFTTFHVPFMPLVFSTDAIKGSLAFDANISLIGRIGLIQDPIDFNATSLTTDIQSVITGGSGTSVSNGDFTISNDGTNINFRLTNDNDTVAIVKAAYVAELALGYGLKLWNNADGKLFGGVRGKYYQVEMYRDIVRVAGDNFDSETALENITDADRNSQNDFGLDLGVMWQTSNYQLGATLTNINEPSFEYNTIDTSVFSDTRVIGLINDARTYTMESQLKLEGSFHTENKNWQLGVAVDANSVSDPMGDEYKWAVFSASYISGSWWIPNARFGYRKNLAGSEMNYLTGGLNLFGVNLDIAYSTDTVQVDNDEVTRGFIINFGSSYTF